MRSKKVTLSIPWRLWEAYEKHAPEVGYASAQHMLTWMPLYSLTVGTPHHATAPLSHCPPAVQDEIIEEIVSQYERGERPHGSYFQHVLERVVEKFDLPVSPDLLKSLVRDAVKENNKPPTP